ncbi:MAG: (2Fe-2S)-binding protein, partial [bacterium]
KLMKKIDMSITVNGRYIELSVYPWKTLLEILRDELYLTGTKEGCGKGECGACTVLLDGKPVPSCLILASSASGHNIITIEGIGTEKNPHPLQIAFVKHGAIQCGFCTPGFVVSAKALLDRKHCPTIDEIKEAISGNLCRCTGYKKIVEAIKSVAQSND